MKKETKEIIKKEKEFVETVPAETKSRSDAYYYSVNEIKTQIDMLHKIYTQIMQKDKHYGIIPGCGDKPTLLKAGAEKIAFAFHLVPSYTITKTDLPRNHREYEIICMLSHQGIILGEGVGCATTMEKKHRYRSGEIITTELVDKNYWVAKRNNDQEAMRGMARGRFAKKIETGEWYWAIHSGKIENEDIADQYNTVLKMAKKRALVDAVLTVTAASDIFTQDIEDMDIGDNTNLNPKQLAKRESVRQAQNNKKNEEEKSEASNNIPINAEINKEIINNAIITWENYFNKTEVESKIKVKEIILKHYGIKFTDYNQIDKKQAEGVAHTLLEEVEVGGEVI